VHTEVRTEANTEQTVFLNGAFMPLSEARIPVLDRGFIFGDGVYEVVPVYGRKPFRWAQHHARLVRSLGELRIDNPRDATGWRELVDALIARHPWDDQFVYMQVTRGVAKRDHGFPKGIVPTVFAMTSPLAPVPAAQLQNGVDAVSLPDQRWLRCDIKSVSLLGNVLARQSAVDAGAVECVMFRDGFLTEGSSSNIWMVKAGRVIAPSCSWSRIGVPCASRLLIRQPCAEGFAPAWLSPRPARCGRTSRRHRQSRRRMRRSCGIWASCATCSRRSWPSTQAMA
jgi:D-amino acid aminotransferase